MVITRENINLSSSEAVLYGSQFYRYQVFIKNKTDIGVLLAFESLEEYLFGRGCPREVFLFFI